MKIPSRFLLGLELSNAMVWGKMVNTFYNQNWRQKQLLPLP